MLSHNTIRGAAGAAILNAEILEKLGKLDPVKTAANDPGGGACMKSAGPSYVVDEIRRHLGRGRSGHRPHRANCGRTAARGALPIVVVSAMAKVTDQLIAAANAAGRGDRAGALR